MICNCDKCKYEEGVSDEWLPKSDNGTDRLQALLWSQMIMIHLLEGASE